MPLSIISLAINCDLLQIIVNRKKNRMLFCTWAELIEYYRQYMRWMRTYVRLIARLWKEKIYCKCAVFVWLRWQRKITLNSIPHAAAIIGSKTHVLARRLFCRNTGRHKANRPERGLEAFLLIYFCCGRRFDANDNNGDMNGNNHIECVLFCLQRLAVFVFCHEQRERTTGSSAIWVCAWFFRCSSASR